MLMLKPQLKPPSIVTVAYLPKRSTRYSMLCNNKQITNHVAWKVIIGGNSFS